jgi:hypothetical protein
MSDPDVPRSRGEVLPLRATAVDRGGVRLGRPRLEPLTAAQQAEAVELLAMLFAAAAQSRAAGRPRRAA